VNAPLTPEGALRAVLEESRLESGLSRADLTVLATQVDPYRLDTPSGHRDGAWLADQMKRLLGPDRKIHWRGLHYAIVACGDVVKPNGETYRNTDEDWNWLSTVAGKAARWLGYLDFGRIVDNRNDEPIINRKACLEAHGFMHAGARIRLPHPSEFVPRPEVIGFDGRQPYALAIFGEKGSLAEVLAPIAETFDADLYLPAGEISDSLLYRMARDADEDGRPLVLFVLADFDPAGHQMSVSMGRKLQALRDLRFPDLEFEVVRIGLTAEQVRELNLPSTPLKETEKRADRWREAFGTDQTEIDALATLRPDELRRIVIEAMSPFYDFTLDERVEQAKDAWRRDARQSLEEQVGAEKLAALEEKGRATLTFFAEEIDQLNAEARKLVEGDIRIPSTTIPGPDLDDRPSTLALIISSAWSWVRGTRALIAYKAYERGDR
jgi:hypothetical protein